MTRLTSFITVTIAIAIVLCLGGCSIFGGGGSTKQSTTEVIPGKSNMVSDINVQQPSNTTMHIKAERTPNPLPPEPQPQTPVVVHIKVMVK